MTDFRARRAPSIPGRVIEPIANARPAPLTGREKRRGERVNSRVPIALEWSSGGEVLRREAQTRVVGPYGCMVVLPSNLEVSQTIRLTNMVNKESNQGVIVWRGMERPEGWELGIELINPQMGFWGLDI
jgi:hypothetical protein